MELFSYELPIYETNLKHEKNICYFILWTDFNKNIQRKYHKFVFYWFNSFVVIWDITHYLNQYKWTEIMFFSFSQLHYFGSKENNLVLMWKWTKIIDLYFNVFISFDKLQ
jgi:hypothetical protein